MLPPCLRQVSLWLVCLAAAPLARALLTFNDGKDQIFVSSTYAFGYDTNVFARTVKQGAVTQALSFEADYSRRAGVIQVSAAATANFGTFFGLPGQDYADPGLNIDFAKGTGRTTGDLALNILKTNAPDPVANNRAIAWNYGATLKLRYPINQRFYLTDVLGYDATSYANTQIFADQQAYDEALGVNIRYDSKLDLNATCSYGRSTTHDVSASTESFTLGADGTVFPKLTGSVGLGYVTDQTSYVHIAYPAQSFGTTDALANLTWLFSRQITFTGSVDRTLGIASTDIGSNSTTYTLANDTSVGKQLRIHLAATYIPTAYFGLNSLGRRDQLLELIASAQTALTTHWRVALSYAYMYNLSNLSTAAFIRETVSASITATY